MPCLPWRRTRVFFLVGFDERASKGPGAAALAEKRFKKKRLVEGKVRMKVRIFPTCQHETPRENFNFEKNPQ